MTSFRLESGQSGRLEFERRRQICRDGVCVLLTPGLNPAVSDQDLSFLRDKTAIAESVEQLEGDRADLRSAILHLYQGARDYAKLYGREPRADQLAAVGAALQSFKNVPDREIISEEAAQTVSKSSDFTARPQFMVMTALLPLQTISAQLGYSAGALPGDELVIHELVEEEERELDYDGKLSSTSITADADTADNQTFTASLNSPIVEGRVRLAVNRRVVAVDNGRGKFNLIGDGVIDDEGTVAALSDSSITYCDATQKAEINATLSAALSDDIPVWFEAQADVESKPELIAETRFQTRSFKVEPTLNIIRTGFSLRAVLGALNNMKLNLPEAVVPRLMRIIAGDIDRRVIHSLLRRSRASVSEALLGSPPDNVSNVMASWTAEFLGRLDHIAGLVLRRNKGKAQIESWVGGGNFRRLALYALAVANGRPAPPGQVALPGQPCYLGELEGQKLFYAPFLDDAEVLGVACGELPSRFPIILGATGPLLPAFSNSSDLGRHCSLYLENLRDATPKAERYLESFSIETGAADQPNLYDFAGRYSY